MSERALLGRVFGIAVHLSDVGAVWLVDYVDLSSKGRADGAVEARDEDRVETAPGSRLCFLFLVMK